MEKLVQHGPVFLTLKLDGSTKSYHNSSTPNQTYNIFSCFSLSCVVCSSHQNRLFLTVTTWHLH